jgi:hypothetical protein
MEVEVRVSLGDLKRAFRRLLARLPDESEASSDFIAFSAIGDHLEIKVGETSEVLSATVLRQGQARVPSPVFRGIARTLRFYRGRTVMVTFSLGAVRIDRTDHRHPSISVLAFCRARTLSAAKPAKLQNL